MRLYLNPNTVPWPDTPGGDYARRYLTPFMTQGSSTFIRNAPEVKVGAAVLEGTVLPFTLAKHEAGTTYTVSPFTHYFSYAQEEAARELPRNWQLVAQPLLSALASAARAEQFDRVVYVNNWLLSTNLYPALEPSSIKRLARYLPKVFPERAVIFRSLDVREHPVLISALITCGYRPVLSRQVYYQDPSEALKKRQLKEDARILRQNGYRVKAGEAFSETDVERAAELYQLLYLKKYSGYNPDFSVEFFRLALREKLFCFLGLEKEGRLDGVLGYVVRNGVMTQPIFGYDTALPQDLGLYRSLSLLTLRTGLERGLLVNASSGVGEFKRQRGGAAAAEYNLVYSDHLPLARRWPWRTLETVSAAALPLFRRLGL